MDRLVTTAVGIVGAIGLSALVFIGANKLFDQAEKRYAIFSAALGGLLSAAVFGILWGNQLVVSPVMVTIVAAAIGAATGFGLGVTSAPGPRLGVGVGGGVALGLLLGSSARSPVWPSIDVVSALVGLVAGAGLGVLIWVAMRRERPLVRPLMFGLAVGWLFGGWLAADFTGSKAEMFIVAGVLGALVGAWIGLRPHPDAIRRTEIALESRKYIFLAPALTFVTGALVIPLFRTIWLGFQTGNPNALEWRGLGNYGEILSDPNIINFDNWTGIFGSRLFWVGAILLAAGLGLGRWLGRSSGSGLGTGFSLSAGSLTLIAGGVILFGFAIFTSIRGTIANNLWWIFSVIIFAVGLGLAVAVIADRSKGENLAKSMIFFPMAISFVGASVIWRLIYIARPPQDPQTGVFNTVWVMIGRWSNDTTISLVISVVLGLIIAGFLYLAWRGWQALTKSSRMSSTSGFMVFTSPRSL